MSIKQKVLDKLGRVVGRKPPAPEKPSDRRRDSRWDLVFQEQGSQLLQILLVQSGSLHAVRNLSIRGLSLFAGKQPTSIELGSDLAAHALFGAVHVPIQLRPVHQLGEFFGCEVVKGSDIWLDKVSKIVDPMRLGSQLREIDPRFVDQDDSGLTVRWFQGGPACDLYIWSSDDGSLRKVQLFFQWQAVEWSHQHGVRTGQTTTPPVAGMRFSVSETFQLKSPPDPQTLAIARNLLSVSSVPKDVTGLFMGESGDLESADGSLT